jgi:hypothetical protein
MSSTPMFSSSTTGSRWTGAKFDTAHTNLWLGRMLGLHMATAGQGYDRALRRRP